MKRPLSLTSRLTILFAIVASLSLAALGGVTLLAVARHFEAQDHDLLSGKMQLARQLAAGAGSSAALAQQLRVVFDGHQDMAVVLWSADGHLLMRAGDGALAQLLTSVAPPDTAPAMRSWQRDGHHFRSLASTVPARATDQPLRLAIMVDVDHHDAFLADFSKALAAYVALAALGSAGLGWLAARRGLQPLYAMQQRAAHVGAGQLDVRMPVDAVPAEMAQLALSLNQMLARLEDAFRRLSDFSSDIAHELRTPLSNLMTQTQVALSQTRTAEQYRETLASNAEECDRLARTVSDMLFLAKAEHGLTLPSREPIALEREVSALFEFYEALAEDRKVSLWASGAGTICGDRLMIRRAIGNLLSNALRHTPAGGTIEVAVEPTATGLRLQVGNPGPDISADALPHVFERFYRVEKDRSHRADGDGAGLGLAITQAIALAHGGTASATSGGGRTCFSLDFPAAGQSNKIA
ncbi:heavy metal sensor histidine kinase [Massilia sp. YIM B04103]|uniref:heavy metal sensor histidine kinase n=1 Tax=Massilia sp. YIM B04103 TaxID=2963106 RepID=UPI00210A1F8E|nr:heavy metal sensor histidine kinase [Massilia sp. YIM B04103]